MCVCVQCREHFRYPLEEFLGNREACVVDGCKPHSTHTLATEVGFVTRAVCSLNHWAVPLASGFHYFDARIVWGQGRFHLFVQFFFKSLEYATEPGICTHLLDGWMDEWVDGFKTEGFQYLRNLDQKFVLWLVSFLPRFALNSWFSSIHLPKARITGIYHHNWLLS